MPDAVERWTLEVTGRVQGVGYRDLVVDVARELGVAGRVWNDPSDPRRVHVVVQGPKSTLEQFRHRIGSAHGLIAPERVQRTRTEAPDPGWADFVRVSSPR